MIRTRLARVTIPLVLLLAALDCAATARVVAAGSWTAALPVAAAGADSLVFSPPPRPRVRSEADSAVVEGRNGPGAADSTAAGPARLPLRGASGPLRGARGSVYAGRPPKIWWVTVRSGLVPGWGQLANGKPLKAALLAGLDGWWLYGVLSHEADRKDAVRAGDTAAANTAVDRRNFRIWMMGATALYAMLDAYVDAHFYDYDEGWTGRIGLGPVGQPEVRLAYRF